jgi:hypothetical protein
MAAGGTRILVTLTVEARESSENHAVFWNCELQSRRLVVRQIRILGFESEAIETEATFEQLLNITFLIVQTANR